MKNYFTSIYLGMEFDQDPPGRAGFGYEDIYLRQDGKQPHKVLPFLYYRCRANQAQYKGHLLWLIALNGLNHSHKS